MQAFLIGKIIDIVWELCYEELVDFLDKKSKLTETKFDDRVVQFLKKNKQEFRKESDTHLRREIGKIL